MTRDPVEAFLASYSTEVREVALALRAVVRKLAPDAEEKVHPAWKTIAYGHARKFCAISPHTAWVNLQFHAGASLPDPSALLEGTGKSMRHVKLASLREVRRKAVKELIREAAELAG